MTPARGKFADRLPPIFFDLTLKFAILRTVCLTTLILTIQNLVWVIENRRRPENLLSAVVIAVTLVHHVATGFGPRLSLPGGLDFILIIAEACLSALGVGKIESRDSRIFALAGALAYITVSFLILSALLRIAEAMKTGWSFLWTQYDITGPHGKPSNPSEPHGDKRVGSVESFSAVNILLGRSIWRAQFHGEAKWLVLSRGTLALLAIVGILIYTIFLIVIEPLRESALTPNMDSRSLGFPDDFPRPDKIRSVLVGLPVDRNADSTDISPAVKVAYIDDANSDGISNCSRTQTVANSRMKELYDQVALAVVSFECPANIEDRGGYPDILVTVDFKLLNVTLNATGKTRWNSVQVVLGRTRDPTVAARRTTATTLIPGVNLVGIANRHIRQISQHPGYAALGAFDTFRTFVSAELVQVWPDPRISPLISRGPDFATLRIVTPFDFSEWKIIGDKRDRSVLQGLGVVGGLWTAVAGLFIVLYGGSIVTTTFGSKPITVLGVSKFFVGQKLGDAFRKKYPRLESDLNVDPANKGLMSFLSDYLIDFGIPAGENEAAGTSTPFPPERYDEPGLPVSAVSDSFAHPLLAPASGRDVLDSPLPTPLSHTAEKGTYQT